MDSVNRISETKASDILFNLTKKTRLISMDTPKTEISITPETEINNTNEEPRFIVRNEASTQKLHSAVEYVELKDHMWNCMKRCDFEVCPKLKELHIGCDCLQCVSGLRLVGLAMLEKVNIGSDCCRKGQGALEIRDCGKLTELRIGKGSCILWNAFVLKNCPIAVVTVESGCFSQQEGKFEVTQCAQLSAVTIGSECFTEWSECTFKDSDVVELSIDDGCFLNLKQFALVGMKKLKKLMIGAWCFTRMNGNFVVRDCQVLQRIVIGNDCCADWSWFQIENCAVESVEVRTGCFSHCENGVFESGDGKEG